MLAALLAISTSPAIRLEAEAAVLRSVRVAREVPGFSGSGYVTDITAPDIEISWKTEAKGGLYRARVGFRTPGGPKGFSLNLNGRSADGSLPASDRWSVYDAGLVELKAGENAVSIGRGWGWYEIDFVEFVPSSPLPLPKPVPPRLVTPQPSPEAAALMRRLADDYGKRTWIGTYGMEDDDWLAANHGVRALVLGGDFMDYSPSRLEFGADPKTHTEDLIARARKGQVIALSWHWNAPLGLINKTTPEKDLAWYKGFYTEATTFDVAAALADPQSEGYRLLMRDIDAIAVELKKLQAAKVPVLWRPLHEAEGKWFWWGAKGPEPCKTLWRLMFDRLVKKHRLNNLIWVWNSADPAWYPGDDTVDIMSIDAYPQDRQDPLAGSFEGLLKRFDGKKIIGLAEFPGIADIDRMHRFGARWSFAVSWTADLGPKSTPTTVLAQALASPRSRVLK